MRKFLRTVLFPALAFFIIACSNESRKSSGNIQEQKVKDEKAEKKDCKDIHWTHHPGEEGPENWAHLCDGFKDCAGQKQSPIDIQTGLIITTDSLQAPVFKYGATPVYIINNGHTVQFNVEGEHNVNLNGKEYKLLQFHFHAPSEHTINGQHFPLEVHFVHKHSDNDLAVIGIMFKEGKENALLASYLDEFPTEKGEFKSNDQIDLSSLLPENKSYYHYPGSLTTPPCSEVVSWYVLATPIEASKEQLEKLARILDNNFRPVMPLNGRIIQFFKE